MQNRSGLPACLERKALPEDFPVQALKYTQPCLLSASLHFHDCLEIGRCVYGGGMLFAGGRLHAFEANSVYVLPADCVHDSGIVMNNPSEQPSVWQYLFVDASKLGVQIDGFTLLPPALLPLFDWMFLLATQQPEEWQEEIQLLLKTLALEVRRKGSIPLPSANEPMLAIQHKIAAAYASELTVEELARECRMSVSAFRKKFAAFTGMSPQQYIIQTRLQIAHHLICNTKDKMIVIAHKAGFRTLSSFNRLFLRRYGHPPSVLRKNGA